MKYLIYILATIILCWLNLRTGSSGTIEFSISDLIRGELSVLEKTLIYEVRLAAICTSIFSGAGLSIAGLIMQVLFQNQLAGPGVMGVSSGGALAVALAMLAGVGGAVSIAFWSMLGSVVILVLILFASLRFKANSTVLIIGLMTGYIVSALINILQYSAEAERLQEFIFWTMGGFNTTSWDEVVVMSIVVLTCIFFSFSFRRYLDIMLLGERHMANLGFDVKTWRFVLLILTGLLVGCVTAFCGPLAFIGLSAPHIARMFTRSDVHSVMLLNTMFIGVIVCLGSLFLVHTPWFGFQLPLNAVLSIFGAPVVIWLLIRRPLYLEL